MELIIETRLSRAAACPAGQDRARSRPLRAARALFAGGRVASLACAALVVLGCVTAIVPFAPAFPGLGIRSAWAFALNAAVARGLVFGRDIDFTFGPYAAVYTHQYHPATDTLMMWASGLIAVAFAAGLNTLSRDRCKPTAMLLALFLPLLDLNRDAIFLAPPLILLLLGGRLALPADHPDRLAPTPVTFATMALVAVALSLLPLVKVTFAAASGVALGLSWLVLMLRGQRAAALAGAALVGCALPLFWVLGHQPLSELPRFIMERPRIISAYNDAMSLNASPWQPALVALGCFLVGFLHARLWRSGGLAGGTIVTGTVLLLFLAFKAGFVRQEIFHGLIAPGALALAAWIMMIALPGNRAMLGLVAALAIWATIDHAYTGLTAASASGRITETFGDWARGFAARVTGTGNLPTRYADSLRAIRDSQFLPPLAGPADAYSNGQNVLLAYDLDWSPRPVIQSYSAYSPDLLEENARHLQGDRAPENILFKVEPIDGRLPSLEDGLSWPTLLTRYEATGLFGDMAVLRRRAEPLRQQPMGQQPIASGNYAFGEPIPIPATTGAVWAQMDVSPTIPGKLIAAAWKLPPLLIWFDLPGGRSERFRYVAGMGRTGFVISPLVRDTADFLALALPDEAARAAERQPLSISLAVEGGLPDMWRNRVSVRFFALDVVSR